MTGEEIDDIAYGIVEGYLAEGPEYLTIAEAVADQEFEDVTDDEIGAVALAVRERLNHLLRYL